MLHHTSDIVKKKMRSNERDQFKKGVRPNHRLIDALGQTPFSYEALKTLCCYQKRFQNDDVEWGWAFRMLRGTDSQDDGKE
jgi:hypothetical protein